MMHFRKWQESLLVRPKIDERCLKTLLYFVNDPFVYIPFKLFFGESLQFQVGQSTILYNCDATLVDIYID